MGHEQIIGMGMQESKDWGALKEDGNAVQDTEQQVSGEQVVFKNARQRYREARKHEFLNRKKNWSSMWNPM